MKTILLAGFLLCMILGIFAPNEPKKTTKPYSVEEENQKRRKLIEWAYQNNQKIEIMYKEYNGKITTRIIQPITNIYEDKLGKFKEEYIKAYCYLRNEERTFRFDRIIQIKKIV